MRDSKKLKDTFNLKIRNAAFTKKNGDEDEMS